MDTAALPPTGDLDHDGGWHDGGGFGYSGWSYYWTTAILVLTELVVLLVALGAALSATLVGAVVAVVLGVRSCGWDGSW